MTDDSATGAQRAVKTAYSNLGLDSAATANVGATREYFNSLVPDVSALVDPMFADSTKDIGSLITQSIDTSAIRILAASMVPTLNLFQAVRGYLCVVW